MFVFFQFATWKLKNSLTLSRWLKVYDSIIIIMEIEIDSHLSTLIFTNKSFDIA